MEDVHVNCSVKLQFAERAWAATEKTWPREGLWQKIRSFRGSLSCGVKNACSGRGHKPASEEALDSHYPF